ncbi:MFS transporter [Clostridium rectalis]|uniref:MFS transporter n=1 Tax=Clostridium rectalis TaxID=2040295 RepID=UPI000F63F7D8|nr:MFS transporter [Clostridium rectalis]
MHSYFKNTFPALTHKNFRYFWFGQCISLIGTWMQKTAQAWLVYSLTKSSFLLGLVGVFQFTPMLLLSLFAGVLIDKLPKKKIIITAQMILMFQSLLLTILVWSNKIEYWHVLILALISGIANTFDMPARQSFFISLVGKNHLINAIGLNSMIFNLARIIGPAISGFIMYTLGMNICFLINTISFLAVIMGLLKITEEGLPSTNIKNMNIFNNIKTGYLYVINNKNIFTVMLIMGAVCTFAMNNDIMIPVLAKTVLNQSEKGYSFLLSAMGLGSLLGAITTAKNSKNSPKKSVIIYSALLSSIFLILLGIANNYYIDMILLCFLGFFNLRFLNTANSTIQLNSSDEYRGRVMSFYTLLNAGTTPIGNLFAGSVTNSLGVTIGFLVCGLLTGLFSLIIILIAKNIKSKRLAR